MDARFDEPHELHEGKDDNQRAEGAKETASAASLAKNSVCPELWHACAGPLISLPSKGSRVVYFPQGHLEQIADDQLRGGSLLRFTSQHQEAATASLKVPSCVGRSGSGDKTMLSYKLPPQILCRVLNVTLHADQAMDEVYAQLTLVPDSEKTENCTEEPLSTAPTNTPHMFCKTLTASDTSTHGGFSVPRRAAEDCFPPLDYIQQRPSQELIAKDLHGKEWKFRHIFRGQPRRHLLTTGWSAFVSFKKLTAGDAVLFLRDDNGELRLGIRRATRQQTSVPSSMLSSHGIQSGILASVAHAVATNSMFHIFYNPRKSPTEFVIPYNKYKKCFNHQISVGMRFKMKFETEDATERRYTGTVVGINDVDPIRWPGSKWRSLKVGWDEHASHERRERVSPWDIEPLTSPMSLSGVPALRTKRLRSCLPSGSMNFSIPDEDSLYDFGESDRFQKVLQGQENFPEKALHVVDIADGTKYQEWNYNLGNKNHETSATRRAEHAVWPSSRSCHDSPPLDLTCDKWKYNQFCGFKHFSSTGYPHEKEPQSKQQSLICFPHDREDGFHSSANTEANNAYHSWYLPTSKSSGRNTNMELSLGHSALLQNDCQATDVNLLSWTSSRQMLENSEIPKAAIKWQCSQGTPLVSEGRDSAVKEATISPDESQEGQRNPLLNEKNISSDVSCLKTNTKETGGQKSCKLFGFSLLNESTHRLDDSNNHAQRELLNSQAFPASYSETSFTTTHLEVSSSDQENELQTHHGQKLSCRATELEISSHGNAKGSRHICGRTRTKVHKQGNAVGRAVDLSKLCGYNELIKELETLFNMEGLLSAPDKGWHVVYTDNEGDVMLVGDDPWHEFCNIVCKILICTQDEMQRMSRDMLSEDAQSCFEQQPTTVEVSKYSIDGQDSSSPLAMTI